MKDLYRRAALALTAVMMLTVPSFAEEIRESYEEEAAAAIAEGQETAETDIIVDLPQQILTDRGNES